MDVDRNEAYQGYASVPSYMEETGRYLDQNGAEQAETGLMAWIICDPSETGGGRYTAKYAFIVLGFPEGSGTEEQLYYIYVTEDDVGKYEQIKHGGTDYYVYLAYRDGEKIEITLPQILDSAGIYRLSGSDSNGRPTSVEVWDGAQNDVTAVTYDHFLYRDGDSNGTTILRVSSETVFVLVDEEDVMISDIADLIPYDQVDPGEVYTKVSVVRQESQTAQLVYIFPTYK